MDATDTNYPSAVTDYTSKGLDLTLKWLHAHMNQTDELSVWAPTKKILQSNDFISELEQLEPLALYYGENIHRVNGPLLAIYSEIKNLSYATSSLGITALAVIRGTVDLDTWIHESNAEILDMCEIIRNPDEEMEPALSGEVIKTPHRLTHKVWLYNDLSAGVEKRNIGKALEAPYNEGYALPRNRITEWAAAHGWPRKGPDALGEMAEKISNGTKMRYL